MNRSKKTIVALTVAALLGIGGILLATRDSGQTADTRSATAPNTPPAQATKSETEKNFETYKGEEFDRYYIANMIAHHQGAVDMAKRAQTNAKHPELKTMANDIISSQSSEITDMTSWQKTWGYPASNGDMMIDHSAMGMEDGMAAMTQQLEGKTGDDFDKLFIQLMIKHHTSAIDMSKPAATNAQHQEVKDLATAVIMAQTKEVAQMKQWQQDWGYGADPASDSGADHDMSNM